MEAARLAAVEARKRLRSTVEGPERRSLVKEVYGEECVFAGTAKCGGGFEP